MGDNNTGTTGTQRHSTGLRHRFRSVLTRVANSGRDAEPCTGATEGPAEKGGARTGNSWDDDTDVDDRDQEMRFEMADAVQRRVTRRGFPGALPAYAAGGLSA
jgi:hypothetical protein